MRTFLTVISLVLVTNCFSQRHRVTKIWETDTILAVPESVCPDLKKQLLYVSLIDGEGWASDGKGEIGILSMGGKINNPVWIRGLNAPKGLGRIGNFLYVADNDEIVVVNIKKNRVDHKIHIEGAKGLNDIAVGDQGDVVFVSDSKTAKIWKVVHGRPELFLDDIKGANGLKFVAGGLIFAKGKELMRADAHKQVSKITTLPTGIDGIEVIGNGDFLVTGWAGYLYYVYADGQFETLLDTHKKRRNAADIAFDGQSRIIYIPSFNGKTVAAYQLK